ncbi:MAG: AraC family transcriptional regulator [Clostridiales bacterium]|nr:AraC family transcriptional regulator [Clostridiales bacterium]
MSDQVIHEAFHRTSPLGIQIVFHTTPGGYVAPHWHNEVEILYPLNGDADLFIDRQKHHLPRRRITVVESAQVHSVSYHDRTSMFLYIHVSKDLLEPYLPGITLRRIHCMPDELEPEQEDEYYALCTLLSDMVRLYIKDAPGFLLEAEGMTLQLMARLLRTFPADNLTPISENDHLAVERIRQIMSYVEEHFAEPISLQDAADVLGLGREYFCRFFRKHTGGSFLQYLTEIRLTHSYRDLQNTDLPVSEVMEKNGLTNQKRFNREFKKLYGCTPSSVRKNPPAN